MLKFVGLLRVNIVQSRHNGDVIVGDSVGQSRDGRCEGGKLVGDVQWRSIREMCGFLADGVDLLYNRTISCNDGGDVWQLGRRGKHHCCSVWAREVSP